MLTTYRPAKNNRALFTDGTIQGLDIQKGHIIKTATEKIPFGKKTVSYKRFYRNSMNDIRCDLVAVVPLECGLGEGMSVEVYDYRHKKEPVIYRVIQVLEKPNTAPPSLELDLEKLKTRYDDDRKETAS